MATYLHSMLGSADHRQCERDAPRGPREEIETMMPKSKLTRVARLLGCTPRDIAPIHEPGEGHPPWYLLDPAVGDILGCGDSYAEAVSDALQTARAYLRTRVDAALGG